MKNKELMKKTGRSLKRFAAVMLAVATAAAFTGCGSSAAKDSVAGSGDESGKTVESTVAQSTGASPEASKETAGTDSKDLYQMDVILDWYPNAIHTFLYDAIDKGYFAEEGLEVNLIPPADSMDALTFVASNKAQVGLTYPIEVINADEQDLDVYVIGAVTQKSLSCLTTLEGNGITEDMSTLKGKKVGYDGTASSEALVRTVASNAGLSNDDYELVNVGFDLTTSLTTGSVDLVSGMMKNDEVITMKNAGYDVLTFDYASYGVPEMYDIVMAVNEEEYEKNIGYYQGFIRACEKGFEDMKSDEDASLDIIMNEMNSDENPLDRDQQKGSYETLIPCMETEDAPFLSMTKEKWQKTVDWMSDNGLINKDTDFDEFATYVDGKYADD